MVVQNALIKTARGVPGELGYGPDWKNHPEQKRHVDRVYQERKRKRDRAKAKRARETTALAVVAERQRQVDMGLGAAAPTSFPFDEEGIELGLDWIEANLIVPAGAIGAGRPFSLQAWQKEWIRASYATGIHESGLSIARGNGKTAVINLLLACHMVSGIDVWGREGFRCIAASEDADKAIYMRQMLMDILKASGLENKVKEYVSPKPGELWNHQIDSGIKFVAADRNAGQSFGPQLVIIDECGLLPENKREFLYSLQSSMGKRPGARLFAISIQGRGPMFREMEQRSHLKSTHWKRYVTPESADIADPDAWKLSNPALGVAKTFEHMEAAADKARTTPLNDAYFRAHELNQDLDPAVEMIVSASEWDAICDKEAYLKDEEVVLGIDLGETRSMTAVCAVGLSSGMLWAHGAFGDEPDLLTRGRGDGVDVAYREMQKRGELTTFSGEIVPIADFLLMVFRKLENWGCTVRSAAADSFALGTLRQFWADAQIRVDLLERKTWQTGVAHLDVQAFQELVINRELKTRPGLLMETAIRASTLKRNVDGMVKVDRARKNGQNDALVAALLAVGMYKRREMFAAPRWFV